VFSTAKLQSWCKVTGDADILTSIEAGVVGYLEICTNRLFTTPPGSLEEVLDGGDAVEGDIVGRSSVPSYSSVYLREVPSGPVTAVAFRDQIGSAWVDQDLADFELDGRELISLTGGFPSGYRTVKVMYPFGYSEDQDPAGDRYLANAQLVVLQLVKYVYERRKAGLIKTAGIGPMRITYQDAVDAGVADMIDDLKRPSLPS